MFHGIAGNGKSRLAEEVVLELSRRGHPAALLSCRAAASGTPLGVFVSLLPDTIPRQGVSMVVAAREAITERLGEQRLILGLDDVHLLDASSAALVSQLVTADAAVLIATHRNMAVVHEPVALLWHEDFCRHVHVPALDRAATAQLAEAVLGRPAADDVVEELWNLTLGNPLFATTVLAHPDFTTGAADDVVERVIADQLAGLPPELRDALAVAALAEPIGATIMERLSDSDALVALERRLLIRPERNGRRIEIRMRHPVYGEHIRATTSRLLTRGIRGQLIDAVIELGARRTDDLTHLADWSVKVGRALPAELATRTSRHALERDDPVAAERIGSLAWEESGSTEAACATAEARYELGDGQAVLDLVTAALPAADAATADRLVDVGVRAALYKCGDPALATSLLIGSGRDARHIADGVVEIDTLPPLDRALKLVGEGRLLDAETELRAAFDERSLDIRSSTALTAATLGWVLTWMGRPTEGAELAGRAANALTASGHRTLAKWAWLVTGLGGVTVRSPAIVDDALAQLDALTMPTSLDGLIPLVVAGRHRLAHDRDAARRALVDGAAAAEARGRWFEEACHLDELARLGERPATRLAELAAEHGGLVAMFADGAAALVAHEDEGLAGVAERFAELGALGLASLTMADAAEHAAEAGRPQRARRWRTRWHELAAGCDAPISLAPTIAAEPLTAREQEIALMVVDGGTSRQIADRFGLSVRTVDNHLSHIFTKLGISSRADLRAALDQRRAR